MKPTPKGTPCQDADPCVVKSACDAGKCVPSAASWCQCKQDADCAKLPGADACLGSFYCAKSGFPYTCKLNPGSKVKCDPAKDTACAVNSCDPAKAAADPKAACALKPKQSGTPCDDGKKETVGDACQGGACKPGTDLSLCSKNADCDALEDGNVCNGTLFCDKNDKSCKLNPATVIACPTAADTGCVKNTCNPGSGTCELKALKNGTACDDGDKCTAGDICLVGKCAGGSEFTCPCKTDADCLDKDDGDLCNGVFFCNKASKKCQFNPQTMVICPTVDNTACSVNACAPKTGKCAQAPIVRTTQHCDAGATGKGQACRRVLMPPGAATATNVGCNDNNSCTAGERCGIAMDGKGVCTGGVDTCPCKTSEDCLAEDDGDRCNGLPVCLANGKCDKTKTTKPTFCNPNDDTACVANQCDPATGVCGLSPRNLGKPCDDGKPCTVASTCSTAGTCTGGKPDPCDDGNPCTQDKCAPPSSNSPGGCQHPALCNDGNACTIDSCDKKTGLCTFATKPMDGKVCGGDGDGCTINDACGGGVCKAGPRVKCPPSTQACFANTCVSTSPTTFQCVAKAAPSGTPCDDGDSCSLGDLCDAGGCKRGARDKLRAAALPGLPTGTVLNGVVAIGKGRAAISGYVPAAGKTPVWVLAQLRGGRIDWLHTHAPGGDKYTDLLPATPQADGLGGVVSAGTGYATVGRVARVVARDGAGKPTWSFDFSAGGNGTSLAAMGLSAGGHVVFCGAWQSTIGGALKHRPYIATAATDGKKLGFDVIAGIGSGHLRMALRADAGVWLSDSVGSSKDRKSTLVRVDAARKTAVTRAFGGEISGIEALQTAGNGVIVSGYSSTAGSRGVVLRLDAQAKTVWSTQLLAGTQTFSSASLGGARVAVGTTTGGGFKPLIAGLGGYGHVFATRTFAGLAGARLLAVAELDDGTFVAVGSSPKTPILVRGDAWLHTTCKTAGACADKRASDCDDANPCTTDLCSAAFAKCASVPNNGACSDGDVCTPVDVCKGGACEGSGQVKCDDGKVCTADSCDPKKGCQHKPAAPGTGCDDGDQCTKLDRCDAKQACVGQKDNCDDNIKCTWDRCIKGKGCFNEEVYANCDDKNPCTVDVCLASKGGCVYSNNTEPCDDGVACTVGAVCKDGKCAAGKVGKLWVKDLGRGDIKPDPAPMRATAMAADGAGGVYAAATAHQPSDATVPFTFSAISPTNSGPIRARAVRLDALGAVVWDRFVGDSPTKGGDEAARAVVNTAKGPIVFGHGTTLSKGGEDGFGVGLSAKDGSRRWLFRYGDIKHDMLFAASPAAAGSGAAAAGMSYNDATKSYDGWLVLVADLGFQLASLKLGGSAPERINAIIRHGKGYAMAGVRKAGDDDTWLLTTDAAGKLTWERSYRLSGRHDYPMHLVSLADGGLAVAGTHFATTGTDSALGALFMAVDAVGVPRWRKVEDATGWVSLRTDNPVGVFGLSGKTELLAVGSHKSDHRTVRRIRLSDGATVYKNNPFDPTLAAGYFRASSGVALPGGGFVAAGYDRDGKGKQDRHLRLIRSDSWGSAVCKHAGACADLTPADCDDNNPCTVRGCKGGKCTAPIAKGLPCDGDDFCMEADVCNDKGACKGTAEKLRAVVEDLKAASHTNHYEQRRGVVALGGGAMAVFGFLLAATWLTYGLIRTYGPGGVLRTATNVAVPRNNNWIKNTVFVDGTVASEGRIAAVGNFGEFGVHQGYHYRYGLFAITDAFGTLQSRLIYRPTGKPQAASRSWEAAVEIAPGKFVAGGYESGGPWLVGISADAPERSVELAKAPGAPAAAPTTRAPRSRGLRFTTVISAPVPT